MSLNKIKTTNEKYRDQLLFMATLIVPAYIFYGINAVVQVVVSLSSAFIIDYIFTKIRGKKFYFTDASLYVYALAFALLLPSDFPIYLNIFGVIIMIALGKHAFGGNKNYIFSPIALAAVFLIVSFPGDMLFYPKNDSLFPVFKTNSSELERGIENILSLGTLPPIDKLDLLIGNFSGAIGTTCVLVLAVCALSLVIRKSISFTMTATTVLTISAYAWLFPRAGEGVKSAAFELAAGFVLFGTVFLANDPQLLPKTRAGRGIYGFLLGLITMIFRTFGKADGAFLFALLFANAICINVDSFVMSISDWMATYLASFERLRSQTLKDNLPKAEDTQEIDLPKVIKYDTPEVKSEVIPIEPPKKASESIDDKKRNGNIAHSKEDEHGQ
ncbi:MAG: RnfABCDGE type electron transport complex subunit D [Clostridiales bacterium]|nr:RnfABCDGE type electron transport complex subunit D [Clostridiales bacterium]